MDDFIIISTLVIAKVLWIFWCHRIAKRNGRNKLWAMVMGFLFDFIAVFVYYLVGPGKKVRKELTDLLEISWASSYQEIREGRNEKLSDPNVKQETREEIERLYSEIMR